ncbi:MAG: aminotransferase, partial [Lachnospiraceae bacterium]|nr:aminotransferase [Lachnospiraceae bacterium]
MKPYKCMSREELLAERAAVETRYNEMKAKDLKLDMSRGKPSKAQLDLSNGMMDVLSSTADLTCSSGV